MTVWNHVGRLYMTAKLHIDTMKLATPTSIGTLMRTSTGGSTGSRAQRVSTTTNTTASTIAAANGAYTAGADHCGACLCEQRTCNANGRTHRLLVAEPRGEEHEEGEHLRTGG